MIVKLSKDYKDIERRALNEITSVALLRETKKKNGNVSDVLEKSSIVANALEELDGYRELFARYIIPLSKEVKAEYE